MNVTPVISITGELWGDYEEKYVRCAKLEFFFGVFDYISANFYWKPDPTLTLKLGLKYGMGPRFQKRGAHLKDIIFKGWIPGIPWVQEK